jgi:hypothetical protein
MKRVLFIAVVVALSGCVAVENQPVGDGKYLRATEAGMLLYQIEAASPQLCQRYAQGIRTEVRAKKIDGTAVCTSVDGTPELRFRSNLLDEWDGSPFVLSAKTELMCEYLVSELLKGKVPGMDRRRYTQTAPCAQRG